MADNPAPQIVVRINPEDRALIEEEAARDRLTLSAYVRSTILKEVERRRQERQRTLILDPA